MVAEKGRPAREKQGGGVVDVFAPAGRRSQSTNPPRRCSKVRPEWESKPQRKARRTQRETTWYQGVASRQTRVERGWVMRGLLPWNRVAEEVGAVAVAVQAKWVSRGAPTEWVSQRRRLPEIGDGSSKVDVPELDPSRSFGEESGCPRGRARDPTEREPGCVNGGLSG
jgi:hypothetical protein